MKRDVSVGMYKKNKISTLLDTLTLNVLEDRIWHRLHLLVSDDARSEEEGNVES